MNGALRISVVVPLLNEEDNVLPLVDSIRRSLSTEGSWELLLVDDGSTDETRDRLAEAARTDPRIRPLILGRNYGQTAALQVGFDHARGTVIVTLDGDRQNDPADIPLLLRELDRGFDLVTGYREMRKDPLLTRRVPSWVANRMIRWITGVPIRDNGCSLKAYRRELVERLHLYADLHRFIPALAVSTAGARVSEIPVRHHPRRAGTSKYGLSRTWKVLSDLLMIKLIRSFHDRPLVLFGSAGAWSMGLAAALGVPWLLLGPTGDERTLILPGITALLVGLGIYLFMLGIVAESALFHTRRRRLRSPLLATGREGWSGPMGGSA